MPKGHYDRATMKRSDTIKCIEKNTLIDQKGFQETYKRSLRGIKKGQRKDFDAVHKDEIPRTPFEALRFKLKLTQAMWAECIDSTPQMVASTDRGTTCASVPLAKRMQEEAWKRGIPVTLDELFQHVVPYRIEKG
jgi:hypothetical protein